MREWELKAVVDDLLIRREKLVQGGGSLTFAGSLEDARYDDAGGSLAKADTVLRVRTYRNQGYASCSLDWKGPSSVVDGIKVRDEVTTTVGEAESLRQTLQNLGYSVSHQIDREILQYDLNGTMVRFETYPRMDVLVEVEGDPEGIEEAIKVLEMPREAFTAESLPAFAKRFEEHTGLKAALSKADI